MTIMSVARIHQHTQNPDIDYEIGGTFRVLSNGALLFNYKVRSGSAPNPGNDRISIPLTAEKNQMVWHTHPFHAGWWPSYEDITRDDRIHVLFTRYGAWVFKNGHGTIVRYEDYKAFHDYMSSLGPGFDAHVVYAEIQRFTAHVPLNITFVPYFFPRDAPQNDSLLRTLV